MKIYLRSSERRPDPPVPETDDRPVVWLGIAVWAVLLVLALVFRDRLQADGHGWWVWTPVVGIALGGLGLRTVTRRMRPPAGR